MGTCYNCEAEITLKDEEIICDNCNTILNYCCWNCKNWFSVYNDEEKKKRELCKTCGFFYCPHCNTCGDVCDKNEWHSFIKKLLPNISSEQINKLILYIEEVKVTKPKKSCHNLVPISYGKGRVKSFLGRMEGFRTRDKFDQHEFEKRFEEILDMDIGEKITIEKIRVNGTYGQEFRDAINLAICLGEIKAHIKENKKGIKYILYERIKGTPCGHLVKTQDLIITECKKCNKKFPKETKVCDKCIYTKGGKINKQGEPFKLNVRLTTKDSCSLSRSLFKKKEDIEDGETKVKREMGSLQSWGI